MPVGMYVQRAVDAVLVPIGGVHNGSGTVITAGTAYFVCWGRMKAPLVINHVYTGANGTVGAGAQTAEIGLFTTPDLPNKSNQTLTKLVATGTVDSFTSNGLKGNTSAFAHAVPAGVVLWGGIRISMATTQPKTTQLGGDRGLGYVLVLAGAGALTASSTFAGSVPALTSDFVGFNSVGLWGTTF